MLYSDRLTIMPMPTATQNRPSAVQVAKCLVDIAWDEQETLLKKAGNDDFRKEISPAIDHLKLQKLVYLAQALRLAAYDQKLFDEKIEAWPLGPVISSVYQEFKPNGANIIPKEQGSCDGIDNETKEFLRQIWLEFGKYSSIQLVNLTHRHRPWQVAREKGVPIDEEDMRVFYKTLLQPSIDTEPATIQ